MAERRKLRHLRVFALFQRELRQNLQHENRPAMSNIYIFYSQQIRNVMSEEEMEKKMATNPPWVHICSLARVVVLTF